MIICYNAIWHKEHHLYTRAASNPVAPAAYSNPLWDIKSSLVIEGSLCFGAISYL